MGSFAFLCLLCLAATTAAAAALTAASPVGDSATPAHWPGHGKPAPVFKVSAFKDVTAYVLERTQQALAGKLDVRLKWVNNADEAHSDIKTGAANLASMSYDDTISAALQEGNTNIVAAWPVHGSMMQLCGVIDVAAGKVRVGIDTDTGYARMLRQYLKSTLSPADYSKIIWVYAGATNLRYEQLLAGDLDATLLNQPFTSKLPATVSCTPFDQFTGPIQGTVGNVRRNELYGTFKQRLAIKTFLDAFKSQIRDMRSNPVRAKEGLKVFYNVTDTVASNIYDGLWGMDGLQTSFCFEYDRLANVERIFSADTGISVPSTRWWVVDWGCQRKGGHGK